MLNPTSEPSSSVRAHWIIPVPFIWRLVVSPFRFSPSIGVKSGPKLCPDREMVIVAPVLNVTGNVECC